VKPPDKRGGGPDRHAGTAPATTTSTTAKKYGHRESKEGVYPSSFAAWDALMRECPFGAGWSA
jgi:hypothetical protein